jgi:predicted fused transcriptional regulator/phosphomethylpyrimidine kinase/predicted transcriptional regulator
MRFPCEFISSTFLPGLRIRVAHQLRDKGKSQNEIAQLLGVKQPVIVSYLQKEIANTGNEKINHHLDAFSENVSSMLASQEQLEDIMKSICTKCKTLRVNGPICSIHKQILPELADFHNCNICSGYDALPSIEERAEILGKIKESLIDLDRIDGFYEWVPEIGSQLAVCDEDASNLDDVASIPGRIIKIKGNIATISPPEYGSSKTMSSLLLWIRKHQPNIEWIISIKNKSNLAKILTSLKIPFEELKELDLNWDNQLKEVSKKPTITSIRAILDSGSIGYEPMGYLFADKKESLLDLIKSISNN